VTALLSALDLAARGFKVLPIKAGAKYPPLWRDWPARATSEPQAEDFPDGCNVAIHAVGLVVLDVDPRNGGDTTLVRLDLERDGLPVTLTTLTPTGGRHLFYRLPEGHPGVPNRAGSFGPGIDVKSTRGYVVAPGSRTEKGEYRFEDPDTPVADAPEWLVQELGVSAERVQRERVDVPDADEASVERARDWIKSRPVADEAYRTACGLRDFGLSERQALAVMLAHDGRSAGVLAPKVSNAYSYATGRPGAKAVTVDDFPSYEAQESAAAPRTSKMPGGPIRLSELAARRVEGPGYLVKGVLSRGSYSEIYGDRGEGKTFVALDLAYHVAAGTPWMGKKTRQGTVLYLAYEGAGGLVKRAQALRQKYGDSDVSLYVMSAGYNLREPSGRQALGGTIAALPEKPSLIVVDTFARALMGGDENSAQDVGAFNAAIAALIDSTGACVLLLHHTGKDKARGARGSTALGGAIDTEILVDSGVFTQTKQRDIEMGSPVGFKLTPVLVGFDEDDDDVTSCVVDAAAIAAQPDGVQLRGNAQRGWDALVALSPNNEPVRLNVWRDACAEFLGSSGDRRRFYDIRTRLEASGLITIEGDMVSRRLA
jgi:hypothetical protein